MNKNYGTTRQMAINEQVQSMCRKDGGSLCQVEIWNKNGSHGIQTYDPRTAEQIAFDVRYNGGIAIVTEIK